MRCSPKMAIKYKTAHVMRLVDLNDSSTDEVTRLDWSEINPWICRNTGFNSSLTRVVARVVRISRAITVMILIKESLIGSFSGKRSVINVTVLVFCCLLTMNSTGDQSTHSGVSPDQSGAVANLSFTDGGIESILWCSRG